MEIIEDDLKFVVLKLSRKEYDEYNKYLRFKHKLNF